MSGVRRIWTVAGPSSTTLDNTALGCDATFSSSVIMPNQDAYNAGVYIPRRDENEPKDGGQYGLKFDYAFPESKAKIGTYFFNYHSRLPYYSVTKEDSPLPRASPQATISPTSMNTRKTFRYSASPPTRPLRAWATWR